MGIVTPEEIKWESLERQFEGGGDDSGGRDGDNGGDGWKPERPDRGEDLSAGAGIGFIGGMVVGVGPGLIVGAEVQKLAINRYKDEQGVVSVPSKASAIEQGMYRAAVNEEVEMTVFGTSMIVLAGLGMVVGHKIQQRFKER